MRAVLYCSIRFGCGGRDATILANFTRAWSDLIEAILRCATKVCSVWGEDTDTVAYVYLFDDENSKVKK